MISEYFVIHVLFYFDDISVGPSESGGSASGKTIPRWASITRAKNIHDLLKILLQVASFWGKAFCYLFTKLLFYGTSQFVT